MDAQHATRDNFYTSTLSDWPEWEALTRDIEADVCVIGGGLAGVTVARELAGHGVSTVLLEAESIASQASGCNGGFISAGYAATIDELERRVGRADAQTLWALSGDGVRYVHEAIDTLEVQSLVCGRGWLKVWRVNDAEAVLRHADLMNSHYDADYSVWEKLKVREHLRTDRYFHGLYDRSAFHINPLRYALALAHSAWRRGADVYEHSKALAIHRDAHGWQVDTAQGRVQCAHVVLCTSATRSGLYRPLERAIVPVATYVIASEIMTEKLTQAIRFKGCVADTRRAGDYFRLFPEGVHNRLLWGGRISTQTDVPDDLPTLLSKDIQTIFPQLGYFQIDHAWAGLMGYAMHKMPIIGEMEPGLWAATAFGGHGLNTTAMAGTVIASAIAEGDDRWRLFSPFAARWGGGALGRLATQATYWYMQLQDRRDERHASKAVGG